ncbi:fimbrial protein [Pantoea sp. OXWO6B1]|uniref:fimbrial protein n=1 Tax=Pantoea sp. OXWO6B1 TaxID=1835724 RepID=UPI0007C7700A|nr:fimbrial protein [Pantoea sp. OXWO6B1]OAD98026.1 hypothetical protein A6A26_24080 [Pantoea sp. OXWO6B1]
MNIKIIIIMLFLLLFKAANAESNLNFHGTLVALPCNIPESDKKIKVSLGVIELHKIYLDQLMPRVPFLLHLRDCDPNVANKLSITFEGGEDKNLLGFLAINKNSEASGIAIGLENDAGRQIKINQKNSMYNITGGDNEILFKAYLKADPERIKKRNVSSGSFNASATMKIDYY